MTETYCNQCGKPTEFEHMDGDTACYMCYFCNTWTRVEREPDNTSDDYINGWNAALFHIEKKLGKVISFFVYPRISESKKDRMLPEPAYIVCPDCVGVKREDPAPCARCRNSRVVPNPACHSDTDSAISYQYGEILPKDTVLHIESFCNPDNVNILSGMRDSAIEKIRWKQICFESDVGELKKKEG